jgi:hypothetical protein
VRLDAPLTIDEAQKCPKLLCAIKREVAVFFGVYQ